MLHQQGSKSHVIRKKVAVCAGAIALQHCRLSTLCICLRLHVHKVACQHYVMLGWALPCSLPFLFSSSALFFSHKAVQVQPLVDICILFLFLLRRESTPISFFAKFNMMVGSMNTACITKPDARYSVYVPQQRCKSAAQLHHVL